MMAWRRQGLLLAPPVAGEWSRTHVALPVVEPLGDDRVRIYFCSRDHVGLARLGQAEWEPESGHPPKVESEPLLDIGPPGSFDDRGMTTGCLVVQDGRRYLYYSGWTLGGTVPFHFFVGCAVSEDGHRFERVSPAPVLERDPVDPFLTASPSILIENGVWRMWYVSGTGWRREEDRWEPKYHIKYAESNDGISWRRRGHICLDYSSPREHAFGRPCVVKDGDRYRMWYCSRGDSYRLGYAESNDGLVWRRLDEGAGLELAPEGWDSEMIAYPWVFEHGGHRHLLYNGNGYGRTGIGWAVLE